VSPTQPAQPVQPVHIPGQWYVACLSRELGRRRPLARTVCGIPLALFRDGTGRAAAVLDRCPHRNVPLSIGRLREGLLECRYHGWRFDASGACRAVPGLCPPGDPGRRARAAEAFAVSERDGFVWVLPSAGAGGEAAGEPFRFPHVDDPRYTTVRRAFDVAGTLHAALENTLDVPHTAFLHGGLFRGGREPVEIEVVVRQAEDRVEAEYLGEPRPPGLAGRLLAPGGGMVTHVDRFILPSIAQVEYRLEDNHLVVTSAYTPVGEVGTRLHAAVTFSLRVPHSLVRTLFPPVASLIFSQDARILRHQADNVARFGGERYASTELDVLGQHILRMLRRAGRGEPVLDPSDGRTEQRVRMRV
jgi:phenylpropionate dioxygenase-like ring-hydroxylating dioxygenase large terminal subunit